MADNRASDRLQKKSNFVGFSSSNLQENSLFWAHFAEKWPVKNGQFCGNFLGMFRWKAFNFALIWWTFFNKKDSNFVIFSKMTSGCLCIYLAISATETPTFYKWSYRNFGRLIWIIVYVCVCIVWPRSSFWQRLSFPCGHSEYLVFHNCTVI